MKEAELEPFVMGFITVQYTYMCCCRAKIQDSLCVNMYTLHLSSITVVLQSLKSVPLRGGGGGVHQQLCLKIDLFNDCVRGSNLFMKRAGM